MTATTGNLYEIKELDLVAIERQARAMQAQALAEMFHALRRGIAGLFARKPQARTA